MSYSDGKTSNRRSQRLLKGLDLADSIKKTPKETLYDSLSAKPRTIVSKLHRNLHNSKYNKPIQQVHSNETDDDCIVISSDDESTDHKSVASTVSEIIIDTVNNINPVVAVETIDEPIVVVESVPKQPDIIETIVESPKQSIQIEIE